MVNDVEVDFHPDAMMTMTQWTKLAHDRKKAYYPAEGKEGVVDDTS